MTHDGLEFHNIVELVEVDGEKGLRIQRAPESVRKQIDEGAAGVMLSPASSEIRFRLKEGCSSATVTLSSPEGATVYVYHGPFQGASHIIGPEASEIKIAPGRRSSLLTKEDYPDSLYDPGLIRLIFGGVYPEPVFYHGHSEGIELPREGDVPQKTYLAYGSSITHGTADVGGAISYPAHVAWKLGMDCRNLGASGCCLCEKPFSDFLAEQDADVVTLEISVNMLGRGFTADEFKDRAYYLVKKIAESDPNKQVVCITLFPHYNDISDRFRSEKDKATSEEYRQVLRDLVKELRLPNVHLIEGPELLPDIGALSQDLIHPGARGMIQIGEELARRLAPIIRK